MLQEFNIHIFHIIESLEIHDDNCKYNIDTLIYQQVLSYF